MKLTLNKFKVLSLVMVLSFAPAGMAKAQTDGMANDYCTMNYAPGASDQAQCGGDIIYDIAPSSTKIPEPSTTLGILMAVSLGALTKRKKLIKPE